MKNIDLVKWAKYMLALAIVWLFLVGGTFKAFFQEFYNGILKVNDAGAFSDFFSGAVTPFLTLAAFFLLLESYNLQKEELKLTRQEMTKSAEALEQQRQIMEEERKLAKKKSDLETFIVLHNSLMHKTEVITCESVADFYKMPNHIHIKAAPEVRKYNIHGYGEFLRKLIFDVLDSQPLVNLKGFDLTNGTGRKELEKIVTNYKTNLFTFFTGIVQLIKFIESTDDEDNKKIMFNILKSSFTFPECVVLNLYVSDYILGEIVTPYDNRFFIKQYIDKIVPTSFLR